MSRRRLAGGDFRIAVASDHCMSRRRLDKREVGINVDKHAKKPSAGLGSLFEFEMSMSRRRLAGGYTCRRLHLPEATRLAGGY